MDKRFHVVSWHFTKINLETIPIFRIQQTAVSFSALNNFIYIYHSQQFDRQWLLEPFCPLPSPPLPSIRDPMCFETLHLLLSRKVTSGSAVRLQWPTLQPAPNLKETKRIHQYIFIYMYYLEQDRNYSPICYTLRNIPPHLIENPCIFSLPSTTTYDLVPYSLRPSSVIYYYCSHQVTPRQRNKKRNLIKKDSALTIHATEQGDSEPTPCIRFRTQHLQSWQGAHIVERLLVDHHYQMAYSIRAVVPTAA